MTRNAQRRTDAPSGRARDTYLFDIHESRRGLALNRMCASLRNPANRTLFTSDEQAYCRAYRLTSEQEHAILDRDWIAMLDLGGSIFYTFKLAQLDQRSMQYLGAVFTDMTTEEFTEMMRTGGQSRG